MYAFVPNHDSYMGKVGHLNLVTAILTREKLKCLIAMVVIDPLVWYYIMYTITVTIKFTINITFTCNKLSL